VLLALAGLLAWWLSRAPEPSVSATTGAASIPLPQEEVDDQAAVSARGTNAAGDFIIAFMAGPRAWTASGVSGFLYEWDRLTDEEKTALAKTDTFGKFRAELRNRVLDERVRGTSLDSGAKLESFATLIGADLDLPPIVTVAAPAAVLAAAPPAAAVPPDQAEPVAGKPAAAVPAKTALPGVAKGTSAAEPAAAVQPSPASVAGGTRSTCRAAQANQTKASLRTCTDFYPDGSRALALVVVPPGEFVFGANQDPTARPVATVHITRPFAIAIREISAGEYASFCAAVGKTCPPSPWGNPAYPAVGVSWNDAVEFTKWLSTQTGQRYRLPTEAEWEYAARGGTSTLYPSGNQASSGQIRFQSARPLAAKEDIGSNGFGLMNMLGNVREWVTDSWQSGHEGTPADGAARISQGASRVVRGGSFSDQAARVSSASRESATNDTRDDKTGFRVVREL
jgi:formylglycine-generating enzyme required for sulfatase activity